LVRQSARLDAFDPWVKDGCSLEENGALAGDCLVVGPWDGGPSELVQEPVLEQESFLFTWGGGPTSEGDPGVCDDGCGLTSHSRWYQPVSLSPGSHILSWYAKKFQTGYAAD